MDKGQPRARLLVSGPGPLEALAESIDLPTDHDKHTGHVSALVKVLTAANAPP